MLAILDYDAGNIESVRLALRHVGGAPEFVRDAGAAERADRIVFPGVGAAGQCMRNFRARGFDRALAAALGRGTPVLAICIGMQLLFDFSEEDGGVETLGILPGRVRRFAVPPGGGTGGESVKIPHMGWNRADYLAAHPLLPPAASGGDYYFVHSYYVEPAWDAPGVNHAAPIAGRPPGVVHGATEYAGVSFAAIAGAGSLFAAQFHPEKSGELGLDMLARFLKWDGRPC